MMSFTPPTEDAATSGYPQYDATDLTRDGNTATIRLGDQIYILRITKSGKLILTK